MTRKVVYVTPIVGVHVEKSFTGDNRKARRENLRHFHAEARAYGRLVDTVRVKVAARNAKRIAAVSK
jgi:hypothetical protein